MAKTIANLPTPAKFLVIAFDICSSSDIIEELTLKGDLKRLQRFLTILKRYLMHMQKPFPSMSTSSWATGRRRRPPSSSTTPR